MEEGSRVKICVPIDLIIADNYNCSSNGYRGRIAQSQPLRSPVTAGVGVTVAVGASAAVAA